MLRNFVALFAGTAVLSALVKALLPEGKLRSHALFACSLVMLLAVAEPIIGLFISYGNGEVNIFEDASLNQDAYQYAEQYQYDAAVKALELIGDFDVAPVYMGEQLAAVKVSGVSAGDEPLVRAKITALISGIDVVFVEGEGYGGD